ncbi:MAG: TylF/MycF family methyltransferase [Treponema sp.]|jgi:hypothetical protein|nr:TylF/MycF family methyltransferase [Treponema sp.]
METKNIFGLNLEKPMEKEIFGFNFGKPFDYENGFYLTSASSRIAKSISHYELYKKIIELPGEVVECGVFKGVSLIRWATYREILESQFSRRIIGFDAFGKFPENISMETDIKFVKSFETVAGDGISKEDLDNILEYKKFQNIYLIKGFIPDTFFGYFEEKPATQIALLHIDVDVYEATKTCLDNLYERVVKGGIIIFDDYGQVEGATKAINEFIKTLEKRNYIIQKLPYNYVPAYMIKE